MPDDKKTDNMTSLAATRTRLAADRTLMAWIRTSFAMIGFGFAILKFFEFIKNQPGYAGVSNVEGSVKFGTFLMILGVFALVPGMIEHRKSLKELKNIDPSSPLTTYAFFFSLLVGIIGIYALVISFAGKYY